MKKARATEDQCIVLAILFDYMNNTDHTDYIRLDNAFLNAKAQVQVGYWIFNLGGRDVKTTAITAWDIGHTYYFIAAPDWNIEYHWSPELMRERKEHPVEVIGSFRAFESDMLFAKLLIDKTEDIA